MPKWDPPPPLNNQRGSDSDSDTCGTPFRWVGEGRGELLGFRLSPFLPFRSSRRRPTVAVPRNVRPRLPSRFVRDTPLTKLSSPRGGSRGPSPLARAHRARRAVVVETSLSASSAAAAAAASASATGSDSSGGVRARR
ncbi:hypothetical protein NL676_011708 [Syzygium grande]|nr:hypothetical protein NL676_011708 [Syzygium grande]